MKVRTKILCLLFFFSSPLFCLCQAGGDNTFLIQKPTIIAFFPKVAAADLDRDADTNEVLSDFQNYLGPSRLRLSKAGIELLEFYGRSFRAGPSKHMRRFHSGKIQIGYYFIAPDKEPHVEYGVMTDDDIVASARKYFGISIP